MIFRKTRFLFRLGVVGFCLMALNAKAAEFRDTDWNMSFRTNCTLPVAAGDASGRVPSVRWHGRAADRKLAFQLEKGDVGGCRSDARRRNGAKFWERAEVKQKGSLAPGKRHKISFAAEFAEGFAGREETFFQIHAWSKTCKSAPLLMLQMDRKRLKAMVLRKQSSSRTNGVSRGNKGALVSQVKGHRKGTLKLAALRRQVNQFEVTLDMSRSRPRLSLRLNGQMLIDAAELYIRDCAKPHAKIGIYRPGKQNKKRSVLLVDDLRLSSAS